MSLRVLKTAMVLAGICAGMALAQKPTESDFHKGVEAFEKGWPTIGDRLPELTLYHPDGRQSVDHQRQLPHDVHDPIMEILGLDGMLDQLQDSMVVCRGGFEDQFRYDLISEAEMEEGIRGWRVLRGNPDRDRGRATSDAQVCPNPDRVHRTGEGPRGTRVRR